ncbi:MAG TPA: TlpA family protein disulfide reductase [candidate division WOR-3 bacterium]|uniref:TlpA family protein disulfide reductase n=1 Tax=candidate division WOR-3 bacterium TaxID=2052148 RepID=A0A7C5H624_UNCW3|nr:TlpA family protein disulfide reductase [candidate division WOR-3 bacterium]
MRRLLIILIVMAVFVGSGCKKNSEGSAGKKSSSEEVNIHNDSSIEEEDTGVDFTLMGIDGKTYNMKNFRGKVVLLDFWASWCGPCKISIPHFEKLYSQYKDEGFIVFGIGLENAQNLIRASKVLKINYPVLQGTQEIAQAFRIRAIPTTFLLDKRGKIVYAQVGFNSSLPAILSHKIDSLIGG